MPELCDVIELTVDLPEQGLSVGQQGTVVHRHSAAEIEVEFTDDLGETIACVPLSVNQLIVVWKSTDHEWVPASTRLAAQQWIDPLD